MPDPRDHLNDLQLRPLPPDVDALLTRLSGPPRLVANLLLVHDVAAQLVASIHASWPALPLDAVAVRFGAATHDIGKVIHPAELSGPGQAHADAGEALLVAQGVAPTLARFARTHEAWLAADQVEDVLVSVADHCRKGTRDPALEQRLVDLVAAHVADDPWSVWLTLDTLIETLAEGGDRRLAWHAQVPVTSAR